MHHRLLILLAAAALTGVGVLAACSDDNGTVPLPGGGSNTSTSGAGASSGKSTTGGPTAGDDDDQRTDGGSGDDDDDDGGECSKAAKLHVTSKGFFCSFFKDGGGGVPDASLSNCAIDEVCCNPGKDGTVFPPSFCAHSDDKGDHGSDTCTNQAAAYGSKWVAAGGTTWECNAADDCGENQVCCAKSADGADAGNYVNPGKNTQLPATCNAQSLYKIFGSKCATKCSLADKKEVELCSTSGKCSNGKDCVAATAINSRDLGYCPP